MEEDNGQGDNVSSEINSADSVVGKKTRFHAVKHHVKTKGSGLKQWFLQNKKISVPGLVVVLIGILSLIPFTRYAVAGLFLKQDYSVLVLDNSSEKPVSSALVSLGNASAKTDNKGRATVHAKVGGNTLKITKAYFKDSSERVTVPILKQKNVWVVSIEATGQQIPVKITHAITGKVVENIKITAAGTEVKTDKNGLATIVLPAGKTKLDAKISGNGYNGKDITITVSEKAADQNVFTITPAGRIYFLSKQSGKIDVVKTNLDGTDRKTVLAGTGKEEERGTVLLASRDWKYLTLLSKRDDDKPKLYLIETEDDKLTTMDEGNATFTLAGWSDETFVYQVDRSSLQTWEAGKTAIKSFNASSKKLTTLSQTNASGSGNFNFNSEIFYGLALLGGKVIYTTGWNASTVQRDTVVNQIVSVEVDGKNKKVLKDFQGSYGDYAGSSFYRIEGRQYTANEIYFYNNKDDTYFEYEDGAVKAIDPLDRNEFYQTYKTYLASPSGKETLWYEGRDGKSVFLLGNSEGESQKTVAAIADMAAYGWYTDDYILLSKNGSEIYILPAQEGADASKILKISDYHKPAYTYYGYGGGYGGL